MDARTVFAPPRLTEYAERLAGGAFENLPIRKPARENPQPHDRGQKQPRGVRRIDGALNASVVLAGDDAAAEECLKLAHALRHDDASSRTAAPSDTRTSRAALNAVSNAVPPSPSRARSTRRR